METTVIIGVYNFKNYIEEAIRSVQCQTYTNWNCIIVDNSSPDNSFELIQKLIGDDNRFSCYKKENEGPSSIRNFGVSKIKTNPKYIHFLDGDDFLDPTFLSTLCSYLENHEEVGLVGCQFNSIDIDSNFIKKEIRSRVMNGRMGLPRYMKPQEYNTPFVTFFSSTGMGPFAVFRASVYLKTRGYEHDFWTHDDADIFCQMALLAEVHYLPLHLYNKRIHGLNITNSNTSHHEQFRMKWDCFIANSDYLNDEIERALKYYYCSHAPIRDFIVGLYTIMMLFKEKRSPGQLRWIKELFKSGVDDLIFRKRYKKIMLDRKSLKLK